MFLILYGAGRRDQFHSSPQKDQILFHFSACHLLIFCRHANTVRKNRQAYKKTVAIFVPENLGTEEQKDEEKNRLSEETILAEKTRGSQKRALSKEGICEQGIQFL